MSSSRSPSDSAASGVEPDANARLFAAASRRAQIVALVNSAQTDGEVAQATVDQLCEALEAEIAFVAVTRRYHTELEVIGAVGLSAAATVALAHDPLCRAALRAARAEARAGTDLLGFGLRQVLLSPWRGPARLQAVIGIGRLYDEPFDPAEIALVEAVAPRVGPTLGRALVSAERARHTARPAPLAGAAQAPSAPPLAPEGAAEI